MAVPTRGDSVGRYLVLDQLGAGGMGVVLSAYDPELDRRVALKLVRPELCAAEVAQQAFTRLQREAQAMARFTHPNVITVFDVGTLDGQLYVAMEYVTRDLQAWLGEKERDWREVVDMFVQAGRGLAAAHAAELVHRDFKPANVLVGDDERPRVSDFGLVAAVEAVAAASDDVGDLGSGMTMSAGRQVLGTPAYMAPEQHLGQPVDARADQFAFCVSLYEELYRSRPFPGDSVETVRQSVCAGELIQPPAESDVPEWVWPLLERGMAAEPQARFENMTELLQALEHDPERAHRRDTVRKALLAFGQHRVDCGDFANGEAVLRQALADAAGVSDYRAMAQAEVGLAQVVGVVGGRVDEARQRLEHAASVLGELEEPDDGLTSRLHNTRGSLLRVELKLSEAATAYEDALSYCEKAYGDNHVQTGLLTSNLAAVRTEQLRFDEAATLFERALTIVETGVGGTANEEAGVRGHYAMMLSAAGDPVAALAQSEQALELRCRQLGEEHGIVGQEHNNVGLLMHAVGRYQEAMEHLERGLEIAQNVFGPNDPTTANALNNVGNIKHTIGDYEGAMNDLERSLALKEHMLGPDHPDTADTIANIGVVHYDQNKLDEALRDHQRALRIREASLPAAHPNVANARANIGGVLSQMGRVDEAIEHYQQAIDTLEATIGDSHVDVASAYSNLGLAFQRTEPPQLDSSADALGKALAIYTDILGGEHMDVARVCCSVGDLEVLRGDHASARKQFERAVAIYDSTLGPTHPSVGYPLFSLGNACVKSGDPAAAISVLERAIELAQQHDTDAHQIAVVQVSLAVAMWEVGDDKAAALNLANVALMVFIAQQDDINRAAVADWIAQRQGSLN